MNGEQFKQSWGQLQGHLKNGVIEQRYGAISRDMSKGADRWYAKWAGWYEGYEEA